jgi:hypothetical protein
VAGRRVNHLATHHPDKLYKTKCYARPRTELNKLLRTKRLYNEPINITCANKLPLSIDMTIPSEFRHVKNSNKNRLDIWRRIVLFQSHCGLPTADCSRNDFFHVHIKRPIFFLLTSTVGDHSCTVFLFNITSSKINFHLLLLIRILIRIRTEIGSVIKLG